ncbi:tryptophan synthase beta subunit-like PLP-dependent enzyme [Metschnikowia bicuspidata var. bicuspidata NRRL YB-4993]|uniref:threonine synthase n=1 Tax=Metschnikowia bicuspidata var. bicuspidata NRRL YB-4993 TaxID=869754 RepID=A0A1A0HIE4_9ASCO|nr:tryptophan synthase beta subunit-like PLP-dependent enzyme [Metschnikowia bicuspidata var. bicuspidata NRRL YB-4993]OBA23939.1 tryptophan synthase beta subunit-like PLP-dependent enzyme [Metschnikowia bicuspidata var. bicuspidata NRRL YB-4993]
MTGLAKDGGLFVPSVIPKLPSDFLTKWKDLTFEQLAFNIMREYIAESEIPNEDLRSLVEKSYSTFRSEDVTPLKVLDAKSGLYILELFHGPTYAFKDVALQFVGNLFEYFLSRKNAGISDPSKRQKITVVGATSGDTGSAAIYGLRGKKDVSVFILYPTGRISPIQEEQMTTVEDANVHTFSVKGTFDDCQDIVKQIFGDKEFNEQHHVGAVNSINWARILAQMTYYFYSYFQLLKTLNIPAVLDVKPRFVVPSGNFGDILAGYYAKSMGLPADKLIIATNENDILDRFLKTGRYEKDGEVKATYSPAMDILISSNFERLLWYLIRDNMTSGDDEKAGEVLSDWMAQLKLTGSVCAPESVATAARRDFDSEKVDDSETAATIKKIYVSDAENYVLDPHTAVGIAASLRFIERDLDSDTKSIKYISLSTAHPAKFSEVVNKALLGVHGYSFEKDVLPDELKALATKEKRIILIDEPSLSKVKQSIITELGKEKST